MICKYFLTVCGLPFHSLNRTFQKADVLNFLNVFLMWIIFKVFIEFVFIVYLLVFVKYFFVVLSFVFLAMKHVGF